MLCKKRARTQSYTKSSDILFSIPPVLPRGRKGTCNHFIPGTFTSQCASLHLFSFLEAIQKEAMANCSPQINNDVRSVGISIQIQSPTKIIACYALSNVCICDTYNSTEK